MITLDTIKDFDRPLDCKITTINKTKNDYGYDVVLSYDVQINTNEGDVTLTIDKEVLKQLVEDNKLNTVNYRYRSDGRLINRPETAQFYRLIEVKDSLVKHYNNTVVYCKNHDIDKCNNNTLATTCSTNNVIVILDTNTNKELARLYLKELAAYNRYIVDITVHSKLKATVYMTFTKVKCSTYFNIGQYKNMNQLVEDILKN